MFGESEKVLRVFFIVAWYIIEYSIDHDRCLIDVECI